MVEYFNLTTIKNSSSMLGLAQGTDVLLKGHWFGWSVLFILAFITFITLKGKGYATSACFSVTCWFCLIISWLLRTMSLIDNYTMWGIVFLTIGSIFALFMSGN